MAESDTSGSPAPESMSFEQAIGELETIIEQIEQGRIGLEQSLTAHRRGVALISRCRSILDGAEQELETLAPQDDTTDGPADPEPDG